MENEGSKEMGISFGKQLHIGYCKFMTTTVGLCMRPTSGGSDRCKTHIGKVSKKKIQQKKFRGDSKLFKQSGNWTGKYE